MNVTNSLQQNPALMDLMRQYNNGGNQNEGVVQAAGTDTSGQLQQISSENNSENNAASAVNAMDSLESTANKHSMNMIDITA